MAEGPGGRPWQRVGEDLLLDLKVMPNARSDRLDGCIADADGRPLLALRVKAPPVDGKANEAVIGFLARRLDCPRSALAVTAGVTVRRKRVRWQSPPDDAEARLARLLTGG